MVESNFHVDRRIYPLSSRWPSVDGLGYVGKAETHLRVCEAIIDLPLHHRSARGRIWATPTTLLIVPYLFAMLRKRNDGKAAHGVFAEEV